MTRDDAIAEITRRLVDYYRPERIYLFGSVAHSDDGADSDLDFLVVVPDDVSAEKMRSGAVRKAVRGFIQPHTAAIRLQTIERWGQSTASRWSVPVPSQRTRRKRARPTHRPR
jgi:hypothetical protein